MLAKEKERVAWSLAIGAFCASGILGWKYHKARIADSRLSSLIDQCKADARKIEIPPGMRPIPPDAIVEVQPGVWKLPPGACEPDVLEADARGREFVSYSTPVQQQIDDLARHAKDRSVWTLPIVAFAASCFPLIWYFLLDRVRELGAAISGKDRSP